MDHVRNECFNAYMHECGAMKKIKQWDHSKVHLNPSKLIYKLMMDFGYGQECAKDNAEHCKDCMGNCVFRNHEIALNLQEIEYQLQKYIQEGVCKDIYELICLVLSHEVMELLCNDETKTGMAWHYFAYKLRSEGYMC